MNKEKEALHIQSNVKNEQLVEKRREQIVQASIQLFKQKGFHRTTTREIAVAAGFSIGTLYEYVRTKEDVLYLICDRIYLQVMKVFQPYVQVNVGERELVRAIEQYITLVDCLHNEFTIMYQDTKSLPKEAIAYVLQKELEMITFFQTFIAKFVESENSVLSEDALYVASNQLLVMGQSWAFRKWALRNRFTREQFTKIQIQLFIHGIKGNLYNK